MPAEPVKLTPGDAILLRGMCGFWPEITREWDGSLGAMSGKVLGDRVYAPGRKDAVLLVLATLHTRNDGPLQNSALFLLTPSAGTCWTWLNGLFDRNLGNAVLL